jgi:hypothetical protein
MMKKVLILVVVLALLLMPVVSLSCAGNIKAAPGEEFILPIGETVEITGEDLSIQFLKVDDDSRCPSGVECVVIGVARCRILIKEGESSKEIVITQPGGYDSIADYSVYKFSFKLLPYPEGAKKIAPADYKLIMTVTKKYSD